MSHPTRYTHSRRTRQALRRGTVALTTVVTVTGLTAAYAVIAALYAREKTGEGQEIEIPMFETTVSFTMTEHLNGSLHDPPLGDPVYPRVVSPARRPYRTADGHLAAMRVGHQIAATNCSAPAEASVIS